MKYTVKLVSAAVLAASLFAVQTAHAAEDAVRVVSRANCLVPLAGLTPDWLANHSWTFNESISYDPVVWNEHVMFVASVHATWLKTLQQAYAGVPFAPPEPIEFSVKTPDGKQDWVIGWRAWAGQVDSGDTRIPRNTRERLELYKNVTGNHWQWYMDTSFIEWRLSKAFDCNLKTW